MDEEVLRRAKAAAFRLLKIRPRSIGEIQKKFTLKGVPADIAERIVADLEARGFLDDAAFARAWTQGRIKRYGPRRVKRELEQKGVPKDLIGRVWEDLKVEYDEEGAARSLAQRRMASREQQGVPILKKKKRVMDYLLRRGFSPLVVGKVIREL
ncbi:MAG: regulatory protein RecX [Elusimicrobia bacterium]|nr:regulatory protein RecX [Elusimicrobiota bacterium]